MCEPQLSGFERIADNLIEDRHTDFTLALHAINSLIARLRYAGAGPHVNKLFLFAVWT